jgi:ectoine hydroxylase-related dioxygenase (phytanoyl-CoA dioxygenase family)
MARLDFSDLERDGWTAIPGLLTAGEAEVLARQCAELLTTVDAERQGDKRVGGTRRACDVLHRVRDAGALFDAPEITAAVASLLGPDTAWPVRDVAFRCPQPGFGNQALHADEMAIEHAGECWAVTAIVALCDFAPDNGATAVVPGSHHRPDLQRRAGRLDLGRDEVTLCGKAGTAFVFSAHLLHRGTLNRSDHPRPALQAQWGRRPRHLAPGPPGAPGPTSADESVRWSGPA